MSSEVIIAVLFIALGVFLFVGQWTAFALGIVGVIVIMMTKGWVGLLGLSSVVWNNANSYILIAVPMFLLMGEVILRSGTSKAFYSGIVKVLHKLPGGLRDFFCGEWVKRCDGRQCRYRGDSRAHQGRLSAAPCIWFSSGWWYLRHLDSSLNHYGVVCRLG